MKKKNDRQFYIERAIKDFQTLVIYFNVTRPQHMAWYKENGEFSQKKMLHQMKFLANWKSLDRVEKKHKAKYYSAYASTFNKTFGIPSRLIEKVLGVYRDDEGKQHRISIDDVLPRLQDAGFIQVIEGGCKFDKDGDEYSVKYHWRNKYLLKNDRYWHKLMADPKYADILTMPNASKRIKDIVIKWFQSKDDEDEVEPTQGVEPTQEIRPATLDSLKWMYERGGLDKVYFTLFARMVFKVSDEEINNFLSTAKMVDEPITAKHKVHLYERLLHCEIDDKVREVLKKLYDREIQN